MTAITINIEGKTNALNFVKFVRNLKYVKDVSIGDNKVELIPLTDEDWVRPGRPATEEEIEARLKEYDLDESSYSLEEAKQLTYKKLSNMFKQ